MSADTVVAWRTSTGWAFPPKSLALSCDYGQLPAALTCLVTLSSVFVLEYYLDTLWKGTVLFIACLVLITFGILRKVRVSASNPTPPPV